MSEPQVKILCGGCGQLIGRLIPHVDSIEYRMALTGGTTTERGIFCSEHGWPDLATADVLGKVATAQREARTVTHRADCNTQFRK